MKKFSLFLSALLCCGLIFAIPLSLGYAEENNFNEGSSSSSSSQELPDESSGDEPIETSTTTKRSNARGCRVHLIRKLQVQVLFCLGSEIG